MPVRYDGSTVTVYEITSSLETMIRQDADLLMRLVIEKLDPFFAHVRRGYYLVGSSASGEADEMSDVDVAVLWEAIQGRPIEIQSLFRTMELVDDLGLGRLDLLVAEVNEFQHPFRRWQVPGLASSSTFVSGTDLVKDIALPTQEVHVNDLAFRARQLIGKVHGRHMSQGPLEYPDASSEFFGYEKRRTWYPEGTETGTKEIVDLAIGCAAPFAAKLSGQLIRAKAHTVEVYRGCSDRPFSESVPALYARCKQDWHYRIPQSQEDRNELRQYCEMVLTLENRVLAEFHGN